MLDKEPLIQSTQSNTTLKLPLRAVSFLQRVKQLRRLKNRSVYRRISSIRLAFSADFVQGDSNYNYKIVNCLCSYY